MQCTSGERLIFVIIGDGDQQLSMSVVHRRAKVITVVECEFVGIASRGSV